jgi:RimJ/RimL family protein N-acetyltransferase
MKAPPMSRIFPDQHLATRRLMLRPYSVEDVDTVVSAAGDELTQRWLPLPQPYTREDAVHWCTVQAPEARTSGAGLVRAVTRDGRLVGSIDLKHTDWAAGVTEIGYWAAPEARGNGYLAEATEALARWTLAEVGFHRVELRIAAGNAASRRVAEKAGFRAEGVARSAGYVHGGRVDLVLYSLVRSELGLPA